MDYSYSIYSFSMHSRLCYNYFMNGIYANISKSLKENKWLDITYINKDEKTTYFWIYINDIGFSDKRCYLDVNMLNPSKSSQVLKNRIIYLDGIKTSRTIDSLVGDKPNSELIKKIENDPDKYSFLDFQRIDTNILKYYAECYALDCDPYVKRHALIPGVDLDTLKNNLTYKLDSKQEQVLLKEVETNQHVKNTLQTHLAMVMLAIQSDKKLYVVAYRNIFYNPTIKEMILGDHIEFNKQLLIDGVKNSLYQFLDYDDVDDFIALYSQDQKAGTIFLENEISHRSRVVISQKPDIIILERDLKFDINGIFTGIEADYVNGKLDAPMKAFFGELSKASYRRNKEPSIVIYDEKVNLNQMRVIYNAMKYPTTYVQGPPGTGKSQTILNVVLSSFISNRKVLVCSSNNKPVDSIVEKLSFTYNQIPFKLPYLRLGNFEEVKKAILEIRSIITLQSKSQPDERKLDKIKKNNDDANKKLVEKLNAFEEKRELFKTAKNLAELKSKFADVNNLYTYLSKRLAEDEQKLKELADIKNEDVINLFQSAKNNHQMQKYLYFETLRRKFLLKQPRYEELLRICSLQDLDKAACEFNAYITDNRNLKLLTEVFPIILSTNISSHRLGNSHFKFDLVIMDEAGQCDIAKSLIPISKAANLLLIGDPEQLKPIILLPDDSNRRLKEKYHVQDSYDYMHNSILECMRKNDPISKFVFLDYHYRCGKKIISFSNKRYYHNELILDSLKEMGSLKLIDVKSNQNEIERNTNLVEAEKIVDLVRREDLHDAMILTPFVNQKNLLNKLLKDKGIKDVKAGTIHSMQGSEMNTIILSSALSLRTSKNTFDWLKNNREIINVGVTRAKKNFVIACDTEVLNGLSDKKDDLYTLVKYVRSNGIIDIAADDSSEGKTLGTLNEEEFFETISHFCSVHKNFTAFKEVKLESLMKRGDSSALSNSGYRFDLVLYERKPDFFSKTRTIPRIAFELDGGEHFGDPKREYCDSIKHKFCREHNIRLIRIPNRMRNCYEDIKDLILAYIKNQKENSVDAVSSASR